MKISDISNYDYDHDIGNPDGWVQGFKDAGVEGFIVGSQWMSKALWQVQRILAAGMPVIATYAEPNVDTAITLAQVAGADTVCLVYEPGGIQSHDDLYAGVVAVRAAGMQPVLYGNMYDIFWAASDERFHDLPLWFASYFNDRHILSSVDFWPVLWGHQYTSTEFIAGRNRDLSEVYDVGMTAAQEERLARCERVLADWSGVGEVERLDSLEVSLFKSIGNLNDAVTDVVKAIQNLKPHDGVGDNDKAAVKAALEAAITTLDSFPE